MGFAQLVRDLVAVADDVVDDLQTVVVHYAYAAATVDDYGKVTAWGAGVDRKAALEHKTVLMKSDLGDVRRPVHVLTFPRPVQVDPRDRFDLPDGRTGPVLNVEGYGDPSTGRPFATAVTIGA